MEAFNNFVDKYYIVFAILSVVLILALIGYFIEKKAYEKKLSKIEEIKTINIQQQVQQLGVTQNQSNFENQPTQTVQPQVQVQSTVQPQNIVQPQSTVQAQSTVQPQNAVQAQVEPQPTQTVQQTAPQSTEQTQQTSSGSNIDILG